jgi:peptidoglycan/xylan/chitin deacetylase (PgdA/CDA1 family)
MAVAYWSGIAGKEERHSRLAAILCFHGTPRHEAAQLERQLRYLRQNFSIVPLGEIADNLGEPSELPAPRVALTFDDGLRNNLTVAYPLLKKLGIPATFFICPSLLERRRWLWTHESRQRLCYASEGLRRELAAQFGTREDVEAIIGLMKKLDLVARRCVESTIREATPGYVPSAAERHEFDLATWDELRELDPAIVTMGSHTQTHPILTCLSADEVELEVAASRHAIESRLQRPVDLFAYPNGNYTEMVCKAVRRHYRAAVASMPTWVRPISDSYLLPRIVPPLGVLRLALTLHREPGAQERRAEPGASVAGAPV